VSGRATARPPTTISTCRCAPNDPAHRDVARRVAERAAVLLRNQGNILPLKRGERIAVLGPLAASPRDSLGKRAMGRADDRRSQWRSQSSRLCAQLNFGRSVETGHSPHARRRLRHRHSKDISAQPPGACPGARLSHDRRSNGEHSRSTAAHRYSNLDPAEQSFWMELAARRTGRIATSPGWSRSGAGRETWQFTALARAFVRGT
jgi:hypothetical protein